MAYMQPFISNEVECYALNVGVALCITEQVRNCCSEWYFLHQWFILKILKILKIGAANTEHTILSSIF